jgi:hypothetical protein
VSIPVESYLTFPFPFIPHSLLGTSSGRRTRRIVAGSFLSALSLLFIRHLPSSLPHTAFPGLVLQHENPPIKPPSMDGLPPWDRKSALLGPPTDFFRGMSYRFDAPHPFHVDIVHSHLDNLRNDTKYMTSWTSAGWSEHLPSLFSFTSAYHEHLANNVMTYVRLSPHSPKNRLNMPREISFTSLC